MVLFLNFIILKIHTGDKMPFCDKNALQPEEASSMPPLPPITLFDQ